MKKDVYTIPEAARICSVGRTTMWRWVKSGELKASTTLGGKYRISTMDLEKFMLENDMYPLAHKHFPRSKILIVDDDPNIQKLFAEVLLSNNYQFDVASGGFEAGVKAVQFNPDLIILDLYMPNMDGFEVCRSIKKNPNTSHIKILAITGYDTKENKDRIMQAGAEGYLVKPVYRSTLLQNIEDLLSQNFKHNKKS